MQYNLCSYIFSRIAVHVSHHPNRLCPAYRMIKADLYLCGSLVFFFGRYYFLSRLSFSRHVSMLGCHLAHSSVALSAEYLMNFRRCLSSAVSCRRGRFPENVGTLPLKTAKPCLPPSAAVDVLEYQAAMGRGVPGLRGVSLGLARAVPCVSSSWGRHMRCSEKSMNTAKPGISASRYSLLLALSAAACIFSGIWGCTSAPPVQDTICLLTQGLGPR